MERRRLMNKLLRRFVLLCSVIGFIVQVTQVSMRYFSFTTTTKILMAMPEYVIVHPVALCIRFTDIIDRGKLFKETGIKLHTEKGIEKAMEDETKLTIEQIFDYTPDTEHAISECTFRPDNWSIRRGEAEICRQIFNVSKFFTQEYMCYKIRERQTRLMQMEAVTRSTFSKSSMYTIYMNSSFNDADFVTPILFTNILPTESRHHAPLLGFLKDRSERAIKTRAFLYLTPADVMTHLLESPYDTKCIRVDPETAAMCMLNCLNRGYAPFNRVPGYELLETKYKLKPLSTLDVMDPAKGPKIMHIHAECDEKCRINACEGGFTVTHTRQRQAEDSGIGFSLTTPINPRIDVKAQPTMFFIDFFSFLCSCFGTWFGISFLSINSIKPLRLMKRRNRR